MDPTWSLPFELTHGVSGEPLDLQELRERWSEILVLSEERRVMEREKQDLQKAHSQEHFSNSLSPSQSFPGIFSAYIGASGTVASGVDNNASRSPGSGIINRNSQDQLLQETIDKVREKRVTKRNTKPPGGKIDPRNPRTLQDLARFLVGPTLNVPALCIDFVLEQTRDPRLYQTVERRSTWSSTNWSQAAEGGSHKASPSAGKVFVAPVVARNPSPGRVAADQAEDELLSASTGSASGVLRTHGALQAPDANRIDEADRVEKTERDISSSRPSNLSNQLVGSSGADSAAAESTMRGSAIEVSSTSRTQQGQRETASSIRLRGNGLQLSREAKNAANHVANHGASGVSDNKATVVKTKDAERKHQHADFEEKKRLLDVKRRVERDAERQTERDEKKRSERETRLKKRPRMKVLDPATEITDPELIGERVCVVVNLDFLISEPRRQAPADSPTKENLPLIPGDNGSPSRGHANVTAMLEDDPGDHISRRKLDICNRMLEEGVYREGTVEFANECSRRLKAELKLAKIKRKEARVRPPKTRQAENSRGKQPKRDLKAREKALTGATTWKESKNSDASHSRSPDSRSGNDASPKSANDCSLNLSNARPVSGSRAQLSAATTQQGNPKSSDPKKDKRFATGDPGDLDGSDSDSDGDCRSDAQSNDDSSYDSDSSYEVVHYISPVRGEWRDKVTSVFDSVSLCVSSHLLDIPWQPESKRCEEDDLFGITDEELLRSIYFGTGQFFLSFLDEIVASTIEKPPDPPEQTEEQRRREEEGEGLLAVQNEAGIASFSAGSSQENLEQIIRDHLENQDRQTAFPNQSHKDLMASQSSDAASKSNFDAKGNDISKANSNRNSTLNSASSGASKKTKLSKRDGKEAPNDTVSNASDDDRRPLNYEELIHDRKLDFLCDACKTDYFGVFVLLESFMHNDMLVEHNRMSVMNGFSSANSHYFNPYSNPDIPTPTQIRGIQRHRNSPNSGETPLHWAAFFNNLPVARMLIAYYPSQDINLGCSESIFYTPLTAALTTRSYEMVEFLLSCPGIDAECVNERGISLVHGQFIGGNLDFIHVLVEHLLQTGKTMRQILCRKDLDGRNCLHSAAEGASAEAVRWLLSHLNGDVYVNADGNVIAAASSSAGGAASSSGGASSASGEDPGDPVVDIECTDNMAMTPLHHAAAVQRHFGENREIISVLLQAIRAKRNVKTPAESANDYVKDKIMGLIGQGKRDVEKGKKERAEIVGKADGEIDEASKNAFGVNQQEFRGMTPIHLAMAAHNAVAFDLMLAEPYVDLSIQSDDGDAVLHQACKHVTPLVFLEKLISRTDIDFNLQRVKDGSAPIHIACADRTYEGHKKVSLLCKNKSVDVNLRDKRGDTPLRIAIGFGNVFSVEALLEARKDLDVNSGKESPLHFALLIGQHKIVDKMILESARRSDFDLDRICEDGKTMLHSACRGGSLSILKWILERDVSQWKERMKTLSEKPFDHHNAVPQPQQESLTSEETVDLESINLEDRNNKNNDIGKTPNEGINIGRTDVSGASGKTQSSAHMRESAAARANTSGSGGERLLDSVDTSTKHATLLDYAFTSSPNDSSKRPIFDGRNVPDMNPKSTDKMPSNASHMSPKSSSMSPTASSISPQSGSGLNPESSGLVPKSGPNKVEDSSIYVSYVSQELIHPLCRRDDSNTTPFHLACSRGNTDIIKYLLQFIRGEESVTRDYSLEDSLNNSRIETAAYGQGEMHTSSVGPSVPPTKADVLLNHAPTLLEDGDAPFGNKLYTGSVNESLKRANSNSLEADLLNAKGERGDTPLHYAIAAWRTEVVDLLLAEPQINVFVTSDEGCLPIHLACKTRDTGVMKKILAKYEDSREKFPGNYQNPLIPEAFGGKTILHVSGMVGNPEITRLALREAWKLDYTFGNLGVDHRTGERLNLDLRRMSPFPEDGTLPPPRRFREPTTIPNAERAAIFNGNMDPNAERANMNPGRNNVPPGRGTVSVNAARGNANVNSGNANVLLVRPRGGNSNRDADFNGDLNNVRSGSDGYVSSGPVSNFSDDVVISSGPEQNVGSDVNNVESDTDSPFVTSPNSKAANNSSSRAGISRAASNCANLLSGSDSGRSVSSRSEQNTAALIERASRENARANSATAGVSSTDAVAAILRVVNANRARSRRSNAAVVNTNVNRGVVNVGALCADGNTDRRAVNVNATVVNVNQGITNANANQGVANAKANATRAGGQQQNRGLNQDDANRPSVQRPNLRGGGHNQHPRGLENMDAYEAQLVAHQPINGGPLFLREVNRVDEKGCTGLMYSLIYRSKETALLFLRVQGIDPTPRRNEDGATALHIACFHAHAEVVEGILRAHRELDLYGLCNLNSSVFSSIALGITDSNYEQQGNSGSSSSSRPPGVSAEQASSSSVKRFGSSSSSTNRGIFAASADIYSGTNFLNWPQITPSAAHGEIDLQYTPLINAMEFGSSGNSNPVRCVQHLLRYSMDTLEGSRDSVEGPEGDLEGNSPDNAPNKLTPGVTPNSPSQSNSKSFVTNAKSSSSQIALIPDSSAAKPCSSRRAAKAFFPIDLNMHGRRPLLHLIFYQVAETVYQSLSPYYYADRETAWDYLPSIIRYVECRMVQQYNPQGDAQTILPCVPQELLDVFRVDEDGNTCVHWAVVLFHSEENWRGTIMDSNQKQRYLDLVRLLLNFVRDWYSAETVHRLLYEVENQEKYNCIELANKKASRGKTAQGGSGNFQGASHGGTENFDRGAKAPAGEAATASPTNREARNTTGTGNSGKQTAPNYGNAASGSSQNLVSTGSTGHVSNPNVASTASASNTTPVRHVDFSLVELLLEFKLDASSSSGQQGASSSPGQKGASSSSMQQEGISSSSSSQRPQVSAIYQQSASSSPASAPTSAQAAIRLNQFLQVNQDPRQDINAVENRKNNQL